jgi:hypothetical protein
LNLDEEINDIRGDVIKAETGLKLIKYIKDRFLIDDISKHSQFIKSKYFIDTVESVLQSKLISVDNNLYKTEDDLEIFVNINCIIKTEKEEKEVLVKLNEENEFLEVMDPVNSEVIFEW